MYHNFVCLSLSMSILVLLLLSSTNRGYRNTSFFVNNTVEFYGKTFNIYKVYSLLHIADDVTPEIFLNDVNAFLFENYLQQLKKMASNGNNPFVQVANRLEQLMDLPKKTLRNSVKKINKNAK